MTEGTWILYNLKSTHGPGMAMHTFNSSTEEEEASRSLWVPGQLGLPSETLCQKINKLGTGGKAQQLGTLLALPEDLGLIPSTHTELTTIQTPF